jgi:hypothetical protein
MFASSLARDITRFESVGEYYMTDSSNSQQALVTEITRFNEWAKTYEYAGVGEWECNYEHWDTIYKAVADFVSTTPLQSWNSTVIKLLLYAVARDNEVEWLVKVISKNPDNLMFLAEQAITSNEREAKWQIAVELSRLDQPTPKIESLLLQFAHDDDEYVRRRAMMALADIGSTHVADLVQPAWDCGDEYQRMAVLYSLWKIGSRQLEDYIVKAELDGRQYLARYAARTRAGHPEHD